MKKPYCIGLDIGTSSTGYAMTDTNGRLLKYHGQSTWGTVLFDEANPAVERRTHRSTRRRLDRREQRIDLLQALMKADVESVDPDFFCLLNESFLQSDDRKYPHLYGTLPHHLFCDGTGVVYPDKRTHHTDFPTIYHIREALAFSDKKADIRYVYLALHHIIKYRGHFLLEGEKLDTIGNDIESEIASVIEELSSPEGLAYAFQPAENCEKQICDLFRTAVSGRKSMIADQIKSLLHPTDARSRTAASELARLITGQKGNLSKLFDTDLEIESTAALSADDFDDEAAAEALGEYGDLFRKIVVFYRWQVFSAIRQGGKNISKIMIERYDKHHADLKQLKTWIKKYAADQYDSFFKDDTRKNGYCAYVHHLHGNKNRSGECFKHCSQDDFYKAVRQILNSVKEDSAAALAQPMLEAMETVNGFLPLQRINYNSAIPNQIQAEELLMILDRQGQYYPTLLENRDRILSVCTFRLPYYVGPLNTASPFQKWLVRKSNTSVYPWNFDEVIDRTATADQFILNLVNKCTYIPSEDVLPLHSFLYEEYLLYDELNAVTINGKRIDAALKRRIVDEVFAANKNVTIKMLVKWLNEHTVFTNAVIEHTHKENGFAASLRTRYDFEKHGFAVNDLTLPQLEELVRWSTVFENRMILREKINQKYPQFTKEQVDFLCRRKYTGWGRLSRKLLDGVQGDFDGTFATIMEIMRKTNSVFMQVLHHKAYGFMAAIDQLNAQAAGDTHGPVTYEEVKQLQGSPALKRGIWQAARIVSELVELQGCAPAAIYIENTREPDMKRKGKRIPSRISLVEQYYASLAEGIPQECARHFESCKETADGRLDDRQFLYFIQLGKCLYSQKPLDFDRLSDTCQIDHILPQCYIKDDSIDNRALVLNDENQRKKDNLLLQENVIDARKGWWNYLRANHLISDKKYRNLTRRSVENRELLGFINRQLVETSQIIKHVTDLFRLHFPDTHVFGINARLSSNLRNQYGLLKIRELNDTHHAYDAFLACTAGTFMDRFFNWISDESVAQSRARTIWMKNNTADTNGIVLNAFNRDQVDPDTGEILRSAQDHIVYLKKVWMYKDCHFTYRKFIKTGEFFDQTHYPAQSDNAKFPLKKGLPTEKYGGYNSINPAYIAAFTYQKGKKRIGALANVPVYLAKAIEDDPAVLTEYLAQEYMDVQIICPKIMLNQLIEYEGSLLLLRSCSEARNGCQLFLDARQTEQLATVLRFSDPNFLQARVPEMADLIHCLLQKLRDFYPIYQGIAERFGNAMGKISELDPIEKRKFLLELIKVFQVNGQFGMFKAALPTLGLSNNQGRITNKPFDPARIILIHQSITGLRERRTPLWPDSVPSSSKAPAK